MELIRPLYCVKEADIISWMNYNKLQFIQCACRFTESCARDEEENNSKRQEMKMLIEKFRQTSKFIDKNIFKSASNVNLDTIISYHRGGEKHSFLDDYDLKITKQ